MTESSEGDKTAEIKEEKTRIMRAPVKNLKPKKWALWTAPTGKSESLSLSFSLSLSLSFPLSRLCTRGYDSESSEGDKTVAIKGEKKRRSMRALVKNLKPPKSELYGLLLLAKVSLSLSVCLTLSLSFPPSLSRSLPLSLSFSLSFALSRLCTRGYDSESSEGDKIVEIKEEKKKRRSMRAPVKNLKPWKVSFMDCSYWQKCLTLSLSLPLSVVLSFSLSFRLSCLCTSGYDSER